MDAVKFIEERNRMCRFYGDGCTECPAHNAHGAPACLVGIEVRDNAEEQVKIAEEWAAAHPRKTRQSVFLEQWPTAKIDESGCLDVCPYLVSATHRDKYGHCAEGGVRCYDCRHEFWPQEVE